MSKAQRKVEPWTNSEGQVINPGDKVVFFTRCTGYTSAHIGKYLGFTDNYSKRVQIAIPSTRIVSYLKGTDTRFSWKYHYVPGKPIPEMDYRDESYVRISTLNDNKVYLYEGLTVEKLVDLV